MSVYLLLFKLKILKLYAFQTNEVPSNVKVVVVSTKMCCAKNAKEYDKMMSNMMSMYITSLFLISTSLINDTLPTQNLYFPILSHPKRWR